MKWLCPDARFNKYQSEEEQEKTDTCDACASIKLAQQLMQC